MSPSIAFSQIAVSIFLALLLTAAVSDVRALRIPNWINFAIVALYPVYVLAAPRPTDWLLASAIAAAVLTVGLPLFILNLVGGGDVKFLTAVSLWAGPAWILDLLLVMSLTGGVVAVLMMSRVRPSFALLFDACGLTRARDSLLNDVLPYGVAIAAGGAYVGVRLIAG